MSFDVELKPDTAEESPAVRLQRKGFCKLPIFLCWKKKDMWITFPYIFRACNDLICFANEWWNGIRVESEG